MEELIKTLDQYQAVASPLGGVDLYLVAFGSNSFSISKAQGDFNTDETIYDGDNITEAIQVIELEINLILNIN